MVQKIRFAAKNYGNLEVRPGDQDDDEAAIETFENGLIEHPPPPQITTANIEIR